MTAARPLLLKVVLGRVLRPDADAIAEPLFTIPIADTKVYLEQFFPPANTAVARHLRQITFTLILKIL